MSATAVGQTQGAQHRSEEGRSPDAAAGAGAHGGTPTQPLDRSGTNRASIPEVAEAARHQRRERMALRQTLRTIHSSKGPTSCGLFAHADAASLLLKDGSAYVGGVLRCARAWVCPWCATVVGSARARELAEGIALHHANGGGVYLVSHTLRHGPTDGLAELLHVLGTARERMMSGRPWRRFAASLGIVGNVRALEVTHGRNGFHPHTHQLVFTDARLAPEDLARMMVTLPMLWSTAVANLSEAHAPGSTHGMGTDVREVAQDDHEAAAGYLVKDAIMGASFELAAPEAKRGRGESRGPFQIGADAARGDSRSLSLWREYESATFRRARLRWTRGLRARLGLGQEQTDEDLADEESDTVKVLDLDETQTALILFVPEVVPGLLDAVETAHAAHVGNGSAADRQGDPRASSADHEPPEEGLATTSASVSCELEGSATTGHPVLGDVAHAGDGRTEAACHEGLRPVASSAGSATEAMAAAARAYLADMLGLLTWGERAELRRWARDRCGVSRRMAEARALEAGRRPLRAS